VRFKAAPWSNNPNWQSHAPQPTDARQATIVMNSVCGCRVGGMELAHSKWQATWSLGTPGGRRLIVDEDDARPEGPADGAEFLAAAMVCAGSPFSG